MYEARQRKEKVSRRIRAEGQETVLVKNNRKEQAIYTVNGRNILQRINDKNPEEINNSIIRKMNKHKMDTWLLAGRGTVWIWGHYGNPTQQERGSLADKADKAAGDNAPTCHSCGQPYNKTMIVDHQPPQALHDGGYEGRCRFYPQCSDCSNKQSYIVRYYKEKMKNKRDATDNDWATGIPGNLFWR